MSLAIFTVSSSNFHLFLQRVQFLVAVDLTFEGIHTCRYALRWETEHVIAVSTAVQDWLTRSAPLFSPSP